MNSKKILICADCGSINKVDATKLKSKEPICGKCKKELNVNFQLQSINETKLEKIIKNADYPVVVDAYADWCGPCKMYTPIFTEFAKENWAESESFKLDTEKNLLFSTKYNIRGIPTTLVFYKGKLVENQSGVMQKQNIKALIQKYL